MVFENQGSCYEIKKTMQRKSATVVRASLKDRVRSEQLLNQHQSCQLMRKGHWGKAELPARHLLELGGEAVCTTNHESNPCIPQLLKTAGKRNGGKRLTLFHERDKKFVRTKGRKNCLCLFLRSVVTQLSDAEPRQSLEVVINSLTNPRTTNLSDGKYSTTGWIQA